MLVRRRPTLFGSIRSVLRAHSPPLPQKKKNERKKEKEKEDQS